MNILDSIYQRSLAENERHLRFWDDYLQRLTALNFGAYTDHLKVSALVPIGNRVLFRGEIQHTNEVTVALGADYFAKCSIKQADILRHHRIKDAKSKLEAYKKEKEYLENQLSFGRRSTIEDQGQDIIEHYTEEEDKVWREKHRQNMRAYKQNKSKEEDIKVDVNDEELWNRLEELELQEELENELQSLSGDSKSINNLSYNPEPYILEEEETAVRLNNGSTEGYLENKPTSIVKKKVAFTEVKTERSEEISSKLDLLQKVLEKQHDIERQLQELKAQERNQCVTEDDLIAKLDEMEHLEELEDEIDRLDDVLENENIEATNHEDNSDVVQEPKQPAIQRHKGVSFADGVDSDEPETLDITFKHSDEQPSMESYDPNKGIVKPSDMYEACSYLFKETKSILKKSKYGPDLHTQEIRKEPIRKKNSIIIEEDEDEEIEDNRTIVVKDVLENVSLNKNDNVEESKARPTSLFKMRRLQRKNSSEINEYM